VASEEYKKGTEKYSIPSDFFVSHRLYSWQVAPQQSLLPLEAG
jgi:hypothetical protein